MKDNSKEKRHSLQQRHSLHCWTTEWKERRRELSWVKGRTALVCPRDISLIHVCCLSESTEQAHCRDVLRCFMIVFYEYMRMTVIKAQNTPALICLSKCFCFWGKQLIPNTLLMFLMGQQLALCNRHLPSPRGCNALRRVHSRGKDITKTQAQPSDDITAAYQSSLGATSSSLVFWPQL